MEDNDAIRDLMARLMEAVETSLSGSGAVREALAELVRNGFEARLFFVANAGSAEDDDAHGLAAEDGAGDEDEEEEAVLLQEIGAVAEGSDLKFELTKLDRDFLRSLSIRPETG